MGDRVGSIADPEHARILELMQSPAYRNPKSPQRSAVSAKVKAYYEKKGTWADPVFSSPRSPLPASRTPDPARRKGVVK